MKNCQQTTQLSNCKRKHRGARTDVHHWTDHRWKVCIKPISPGHNDVMSLTAKKLGRGYRYRQSYFFSYIFTFIFARVQYSLTFKKVGVGRYFQNIQVLIEKKKKEEFLFISCILIIAAHLFTTSVIQKKLLAAYRLCLLIETQFRQMTQEKVFLTLFRKKLLQSLKIRNNYQMYSTTL